MGSFNTKEKFIKEKERENDTQKIPRMDEGTNCGAERRRNNRLLQT